MNVASLISRNVPSATQLKATVVTARAGYWRLSRYSGVRYAPSAPGENAHFNHSSVAGGVLSAMDAMPAFVSTRLIPAALKPALLHACMATSTSCLRPPGAGAAGAGGGAGGGTEAGGAGGAAMGGGETAGAGGAVGGATIGGGGAFPGAGPVVMAGRPGAVDIPAALPPIRATRAAASAVVMPLTVMEMLDIVAPSDLRD